MKKIFSRIEFWFLVISLLGIIDAGYLTWNHFFNKYGSCGLGECDVVLRSEYSEIFGIPTALFGLLYYATIFLGTLLYHKLKKDKLLLYISYFTSVGLITSVLLVYIQIAIIGAICPYCMLSALTSTLLFVAGYIHIKRHA